MTLASFNAAGGSTGIVAEITAYLAHGRPLYMVLYVTLITFFCFFYTRSSSILSRRRTTCASTAASFRAYGRARTRRIISTMC